MNKTKAIMLHLQEKGSITSWEAIKEYGATRLSAIIYNLRYKYGMVIETQQVDFTDRFGSKTSYGKYVLINEDKGDNE